MNKLYTWYGIVIFIILVCALTYTVAEMSQWLVSMTKGILEQIGEINGYY